MNQYKTIKNITIR